MHYGLGPRLWQMWNNLTTGGKYMLYGESMWVFYFQGSLLRECVSLFSYGTKLQTDNVDSNLMMI